MRSKLFSRRLWNKDFILILLVCAIATYPNSILISMLPVYVLDLGGSNAMTGMMMTGLTILGMATNMAVAPLIDRIGRKKLLVLGSGLYALNALLFCFTENLGTLVILRIMCGFTQGIFFPVPPVMASDNAPEDMLVDAMGFFGIAAAVTYAVTPTIGMALYNINPKAMFISGAIMGLISFLLSLLIKEHYHRPSETQKSVKIKPSGFQFDRNFIFLILFPSLVNCFILFSNSAVQSFLTPCGLSRGIEQISLYFTVNQIAVILTRMLVGRVINRLSKRACVLASLVIAAGGTALIAVSYNLPMMLLSALCLGLGQTAATQILQAEVLLSSPAERRGITGTIFMLMGNIGGMGTAVWGVISSAAGYLSTYALAGTATLLGCVFNRGYWKTRQDTEAPASLKIPTDKAEA